MLQAGQDGGDEGLQDLLLPDAAQEAQRDAPDVLVGVLQVVAQVLADEDLQRQRCHSSCVCHGADNATYHKVEQRGVT